MLRLLLYKPSCGIHGLHDLLAQWRIYFLLARAAAAAD